MKLVVVANWKMNPPSYKEARLLFDATRRAADEARNLTVVVAPPSLYIRDLRAKYSGKRVAFAVQHALPELSGAHTGDVSLAQAADAKVTYAIIGHAERRAMGESAESIADQVAVALSLSITPILCVGERVRAQSGEYLKEIGDQLRSGLSKVETPQLKKLLIAYEPVWAIGSSHAMEPRDMHEMAIYIKKRLVEERGEVAMSIRILYGGSVDDTNALRMCTEGEVDGLLVGRSSSDSAKVTELLRALAA